jgi:hypothetical protein
MLVGRREEIQSLNEAFQGKSFGMAGRMPDMMSSW